MSAIFKDHEAGHHANTKWWASRIAIYAALLIWTVICLFPIFWTITTSFKLAPDVMKGNLIPWWDFTPRWKGWESIGLSPRLMGEVSTVREEFLKRFWNSTVIAVSASLLAVVLGSLAAYGLSRFNCHIPDGSMAVS
jgi:multiple sugar transport system permease protein